MMARENLGWVNSDKIDRFNEFRSSNTLMRTVYHKKIHHLPPLEMHYEPPPSTKDKKWSDQSLLSTRNIDNYLAESDAFQRASYANILEKWKEHDKNKVNEMISSFDSHYNMKIRFRHDKKLNQSSEMKYGSGAQYYRFIGNESNPKHDKPCGRYKRRTQEYEERYIRDALKLPSIEKPRSVPFFISKMTNLHLRESDDLLHSPFVKSYVSIGQTSQSTIS